MREGGIVSLLHATWHRSSTPIEVRDAWVGNATYPEAVDYVFAMDADDEASILWTRGHRRAIDAADVHATTVRNWNAAAQIAIGDLLVVVADDLFPPKHWDRHLWKLVHGLDPSRHPFAIKVADSLDPQDTLMRHPVISRALYEKNGLFDSRFRGVYCDSDITLTCFWNYSIIDGRDLVLEHRHPTVDPSITQSESHAKQNHPMEYLHGTSVLAGKWPAWKRRSTIRLVSIPVGGRQSWRTVDLVSRALRCIEVLLSPLRIAKKIPAAVTRRCRSKSLWA